MPLSVSHSLVRSPEVGAIGSQMQGCMAAWLLRSGSSTERFL